MAWIVALLAVMQGAGEQGPAQPPAAPPSFSIRADPAIADRVNAVLRRAAAPAETSLPAGGDLWAALRNACGGISAPAIQTIRQVGNSPIASVGHAPCIRFRSGVRIVADGDQTLKELAAALGLSPASAARARIESSGGAASTPATAQLDPGDVVRFPRTPEWTEVTLSGGAFGDRQSLVAALAQALDCESKEAERCLNRRGLHILNREPLRMVPVPRQVPEKVPAVDSAIPVWAAQWPYDPALIAATLNNSPAETTPATIGVADAGLGSSLGAPLPPQVFSRNSGEGDNPDGIDNEPNSYLDDIYGTGVARLPDEQQPSGSLGICRSDNPDLMAFNEDQRSAADHGAIVSSIASGLRLRESVQNRAGLPSLIFFRLLPDLCRPGAPPGPSEDSFRQALDYFFTTRNAEIFLLSFMFERRASDSFLDMMGSNLFNQSRRLFIVPAGNYGPENLDKARFCPACLGNAKFEPLTFQNTIVVGAAERDLRIPSYSGFGRDTVSMFAPAEPVDAQALSGAATDLYSASTSWAAPRVALAAGMLRSLGIRENRAIRERLSASTWPIDARPEQVDAEQTGVLNLMKAAAVWHTAIEVIESGAGGRPERRTYVGALLTPLETFCSPALSQGTTHSIRLGRRNGDLRELTLRSRVFNEDLRLYEVTSRWCPIPARLRFQAFLHEQVLEFDNNSVVHILLPWLPTP